MTIFEFTLILEDMLKTHGSSVCWEWEKGKDKNGYGKLGLKYPDGSYKTRSAHRMAYMVVHAELPPGSIIMHICDNPPCFNPKHLINGTHQANMDHAKISGKMKNTKALGPEIKAKMQIDRVEGMKIDDICEKYGVSRSSVNKHTNPIATEK